MRTTADPYDFVNILLDGSQVSNPQHNNYAYFNVAKYNKQMTAASLLTGSKRGAAYAALDGSMMKDNPPWAPLVNSNDRNFMSCARRLPDDQRGPGRRAAPERDLPQVARPPGGAACGPPLPTLDLRRR